MTSVPTHRNPNNTILLIDELLRNKRNITCSRYTRVVPNLTPIISSLSNYSAKFNSYIQIYVYGEKFFPNGATTVTFGNIENITVNYLNHNSFYFEVPFTSLPGVYNITVKNNLNFVGRNVTSNTNNGLSFTSNSVEFTITS
jgi:hypothetical protein